MLVTGLALAFMVIFLYDAKDVKAAVSYIKIHAVTGNEKKERTVGNTVFEFSEESLYAIQGGKKQLLFTEKHLDPIIVTNGEAVYFSVGNPKNNSVSVFCVSSLGGKAKRIFSCEAYGGSCFELQMYSGGKICYTRSLVEFEGHELWEYTVKTGKKKAVTKKDVGIMGGDGRISLYNAISGG